MPRGKRYIVAGHTYHVTHRCHGRAFLLKFKKDRDMYRRMLRDRLAGSSISLFTYTITSNHVHLVLRPDPACALASLSRLMQTLEGDFARYYNRRKNRENAFWGDRYHATMIESGDHLFNCLIYIDLNMVRARRVSHPGEWAWTGYHELMGSRMRYRMLDLAQLLEQTRIATLKQFQAAYEDRLREALSREELRREGKWTESLAVGSEAYVRSVGRQIHNRMQVEVLAEPCDGCTWLVREAKQPSEAYGQFSPPKTSAKTPDTPLQLT